MRLILKIKRSLYNRAKTIDMEKLQPKGVATYVRSISIYYKRIIM